MSLPARAAPAGHRGRAWRRIDAAAQTTDESGPGSVPDRAAASIEITFMPDSCVRLSRHHLRSAPPIGCNRRGPRYSLDFSSATLRIKDPETLKARSLQERRGPVKSWPILSAIERQRAVNRLT
jgi:hypothetical protein